MRPRNKEQTDKLSELMKSPTYAILDALKLIRLGADPDTKDLNGHSLVHQCVINGVRKNRDYLSELIKTYNANVDAANSEGLTPLQVCLNDSRFSSSSAMMLVSLGANPNVKNKDGNSLLQLLTCGKVIDQKRFDGYIKELLANKRIDVLSAFNANKDDNLDRSELSTTDKFIGLGKFGRVSLAVLNGTSVALKEITATQSIGSALRSYFAELCAMSTVNAMGCNNVIKYFGYVIDLTSIPCRLSIVMEHAARGSLMDLLMKSKPNGIDVNTSYQMSKDMVNGVVAIHSAGIVHGDLKSANMLIDAEGRVKIADFGLSLPCVPNRSTFGSPSYLAPEVFCGEGTSRDSDVYALVTVMLEADITRIAGTLFPPEIDHVDKLRDYVVAGNRPPVPPSCHPKVAYIVTWGWKSMGKRPTAEMLRDELATDVNTVSERLRAAGAK